MRITIEDLETYRLNHLSATCEVTYALKYSATQVKE